MIAFILFAHVSGAAQKVIDVGKTDNMGSNTFYSVGGEPFVNAKFVRLTSGTPYFTDQWLKAKGLTAAGKVYSTGALKLNLLDNQILFLDLSGNELVSSVALSELFLLDTITGSEYHFVHSSVLSKNAAAKNGWYQQLTTGKASLYQYYQKQLTESKPYGSATTEQNIVTKEQFFIYVNEKLYQMKKPKDVLAILTDKKKELEENLNKKDFQQLTAAEQVMLLVNLYNVL
jgi:hypothetical protein